MVIFHSFLYVYQRVDGNMLIHQRIQVDLPQFLALTSLGAQRKGLVQKKLAEISWS